MAVVCKYIYMILHIELEASTHQRDSTINLGRDRSGWKLHTLILKSKYTFFLMIDCSQSHHISGTSFIKA